VERVLRGLGCQGPWSKFCSLAPPLGRPFSLLPTTHTLALTHPNHTYGKAQSGDNQSCLKHSSRSQRPGPKRPQSRTKFFHHWPQSARRKTQLVLTLLSCRSQRIQTGNKVIKPKKSVLVRADTIHKKHTAGLQAVTERTLAGRAGHLELLRGGKKDRKQSIPGKPTGGKAPKEEKKG
jgi:hypothetical protein